jgi:hypothetical protein
MRTAGKVALGIGGAAAIAVIFWPRKARATEASSCREPVVGQRWSVCSPTGNQVSTVSQGDYDALYDRKTRLFLAVVNNTTYDDAGTAIVVPRASAPWAADTLPAI